MQTRALSRIIFVGLIAFAARATAVTPAQKCEADKLRRAGKYNFCRLKAEAKAVKSGGSPDYSVCNLKLGEKWATAETKGAGECPTSGDLASIQARIAMDADDVAACLNGTCPPRCGDGTANGTESCDGIDLAGQSCTTIGFAGGTLTCTSGCSFDVSACVPPSSGVPATGQTTSYGSGSDGDVRAGVPLAYTDNGDGTITDNNTGLMWEKKSWDGSIHDRFKRYNWGMFDPPYTMNGTMVTTFLDTLNDVSGTGANCFAGYCDWRIPNRNELQSLVNIANTNPATSTVFNTGVTPGCTVLTCSVTESQSYWSSSSFADNYAAWEAWYVDFGIGGNGGDFKTSTLAVRAVRGGL